MTQHTRKEYMKVIQKDPRFSIRDGGKHTMVKGPDGSSMTFPRGNTYSKGVECSIKKWLLKFGIVMMTILGVLTWIGKHTEEIIQLCAR